MGKKDKKKKRSKKKKKKTRKFVQLWQTPSPTYLGGGLTGGLLG